MRDLKSKNFNIYIFNFTFCNFRREGFTFLEIMIAVAIIGVAVIAIFNTVNYHAGIASDHTLDTRMLLLAKEKIAEMELDPKTEKGVFPETDFSYETTVKAFNDAYQLEDKEMLEIKAVVKGLGKEVELNQIITKKSK
jgi:prepilin-type N-terminal cleavage/methylation domain-containing protein